MKRRTFLSILPSLVLSQNSFPDLKIVEPPLDIQKRIQLTIDDGPLNYMERIMENLEDNKVTFYLVGNKLKDKNRFKQAVHALQQGHLIGNHSYSHPQFSRLSTENARSQILRTDELIEQLHKESEIPRTHKLFRFPYGDNGNNSNKSPIRNFLIDQGYKTQFWDTDTNDWRHYSETKRLSRSSILRNCAKAKDGHIVLCHDKPITANHIIPFYVNSKEYKLILPQPNL